MAAVSPQGVRVERLAWSPDIAENLDSPAGANCLRWLSREVQAGIAQLWRVSDARDCLYVITRLDSNPLEWVMCYVQGTGAQKFGPLFIDHAARRRWPMRIHTVSPAVVRLCQRMGFAVSETILRR